MRFLRQNTAVIITVGPFYDKTDGVTIETGLTITNERITLTADTDAGSAPTNILDNVTGATSGTANDLNYITGNDAGMMQMELAAADTNRVGRMMLSITDAANHVPVFHEFFVLPQAIYDWLTGVIVPLPANVTTIAGSAVSTSTSQLGVNVVNWKGAAAAAMTGDAFARLGAPAGASVSADVAAIKSDSGAIKTKTDYLPSVAAGAAGGVFIAGSNAATSITTALTTNITGSLSGSVGSVTGAVGSVTGAVGSVTGSVGSVSGAVGSVTGAVGSVTGSVGGNVTGSIGSLAAQAKADVNAEVDSALNTAIPGSPTADSINERIVAIDAYGAPPSAATIKTTMEGAGGHLALILEDTGTTVPAVLGAPVGASLSADIAAVKSDSAAILTDTGTTLDGKLDTIDGNVDAILADTGTDGVVVAAGSKTGYALSSAGIDAVWDQASSVTLSFEALLTRAYQMINNKMEVTDADGTVSLKNIGATGAIASGSVTDDSTTTTRLELTWA